MVDVRNTGRDGGAHDLGVIELTFAAIRASDKDLAQRIDHPVTSTVDPRRGRGAEGPHGRICRMHGEGRGEPLDRKSVIDLHGASRSEGCRALAGPIPNPCLGALD